jgi:hypothetical protein
LFQWEEMVSDIGGTVELYVGMSVVTFFQFIEFIVDLGFIGVGGKLKG